MKAKGYFIKIIFETFDPDNVAVKDPVLLVALENWLSPKVIPDKHLKKIRSLQSQLNIQLSQYSLETSIGRFIPEKSYIQWIIDNKNLIQKFNNCKNDLILSYDTFEQFIKESNKDLIDKVWNIIHKDGGKPTENFIIEVNKKIIDLLPSKENLYNSINFRILLFNFLYLEESSPTTAFAMNDSNKFLIKEIKTYLINVVSNAFDKVIDFYNKEKQIRNNMMESFKKELNRIYLLYFCSDIDDVVKRILGMIHKEDYKSNPSGFINELGKIKKDLVKEIE